MFYFISNPVHHIPSFPPIDPYIHFTNTMGGVSASLPFSHSNNSDFTDWTPSPLTDNNVVRAVQRALRRSLGLTTLTFDFRGVATRPRPPPNTHIRQKIRTFRPAEWRMPLPDGPRFLPLPSPRSRRLRRVGVVDGQIGAPGCHRRRRLPPRARCPFRPALPPPFSRVLSREITCRQTDTIPVKTDSNKRKRVPPPDRRPPVRSRLRRRALK